MKTRIFEIDSLQLEQLMGFEIGSAFNKLVRREDSGQRESFFFRYAGEDAARMAVRLAANNVVIGKGDGLCIDDIIMLVGSFPDQLIPRLSDHFQETMEDDRFTRLLNKDGSGLSWFLIDAHYTFLEFRWKEAYKLFVAHWNCSLPAELKGCSFINLPDWWRYLSSKNFALEHVLESTMAVKNQNIYGRIDSYAPDPHQARLLWKFCYGSMDDRPTERVRQFLLMREMISEDDSVYVLSPAGSLVNSGITFAFVLPSGQELNVDSYGTLFQMNSDTLYILKRSDCVNVKTVIDILVDPCPF